MRSGLSIGITTRDRADALRACLRSLAVLAPLSPEILVYDDSSETPAEQAPGGGAPEGVRFLWGTLGCAGGRNRLVGAAANEFVLLLDDDTVLFDSTAVTAALTTIAGDPAIGAIAFAQANPDGTPWAPSMQPSRAIAPAIVNSFIGFAHLVRRSTFLELGGYREVFQYHGEEKEFCLRLMDAGKSVVYLPEARIAHVTHPGARDARRYLRLVSRNDMLNSIYNDPLARMLWVVPARFALYFRMRGDWKIDDPGGAWWVLREVRRHSAAAWRARRPVSRATRARWRALRTATEPYRAPVVSA
jgi:GT2 family glycosyltransferase